MNSKNSEARTMQRLFLCIGIVIGIVIIVISHNIRDPIISTISYYRSSYTFGADYYTESYGAARDTANNVADLSKTVAQASKVITNAISHLLLAIGLIDIAYFGAKFFETFTVKQVSTNQNSVPPSPSDELPDL